MSASFLPSPHYLCPPSSSLAFPCTVPLPFFPSIDFFILSMSALLSSSPLVAPTSLSLSPSLVLIFHVYPSFIPRLTSASSSLSPPSPSSPLHPSFTRSPCHRAKPAYLHWNKSTSSHGHFSVVSFFLFFFNHCNPFSYQPEELIKQPPPLSLSLNVK